MQIPFDVIVEGFVIIRYCILVCSPDCKVYSPDLATVPTPGTKCFSAKDKMFRHLNQIVPTLETVGTNAWLTLDLRLTPFHITLCPILPVSLRESEKMDTEWGNW